ncbi:MFS transporter [Nonomuraea rubra]|uniref:MFS family permease n=1 Tax=Nonomuraea rubra TaxID=46180 RepID=A0A7X0U3C0_9ACTN|nr:MFS transporter [Nonomuraea rubra]MBB6553621.1 MFS family permease [Nonomuraea rubra]
MRRLILKPRLTRERGATTSPGRTAPLNAAAIPGCGDTVSSVGDRETRIPPHITAARKGRPGGLLRTRNFGLLWAGESVSGLGSAITTVAVPFVAITVLHASTGTVALLTAASWLPWFLIGLPAGTWVDRWPRRRILVSANLVSAAVLTAVPVAAWTGVLTVPMLLAAVLIAGTSSMFFTLAFNAYLPHLLAPDDRMEGNARLQASASAAEIAGPGLGGLLTEVAGAVGGLLIDASTFIFSAACLLRLRTTPEPRAAAGERPGILRQLSEGLGYFKYGEFMLPMLIVAAMINLGMLGVFSLRIVFLVRAEGIAPGTVGGLISLASLGGLLGAVLASRAVARFGSARTYVVVNVVTAPFMLLLPASGPGWRLALFTVGSFVVMLGATMSGIVTATFRVNYIPAHLLGRVTAVSRFVISGTVPLGAATAGVLATAFGIGAAMWVLAAFFAVTPLLLLASSMRSMRDFPALPSQPPVSSNDDRLR